MKNLLIISSLLLIALNGFGQSNTIHNWEGYNNALSKDWYQSNNILNAQFTTVQIDTLTLVQDTNIYCTFNLDTTNNLITQVFYADVRINKPMPKKFNHIFQFDSLGYAEQIDKKGKLIHKNEYQYNSDGILIKENQWNYSYNSKGELIIASTDTTSYNSIQNYSAIDFIYENDVLVKEIRTYYYLGGRPNTESITTYVDNHINIISTHPLCI